MPGIHVTCSSVSKNRNSRPEVFCKRGVLRKTSQENHLCQGLFFNKVTGISFLTEQLRWLILKEACRKEELSLVTKNVIRESLQQFKPVIRRLDEFVKSMNVTRNISDSNLFLTFLKNMYLNGCFHTELCGANSRLSSIITILNHLASVSTYTCRYEYKNIRIWKMTIKILSLRIFW